MKSNRPRTGVGVRRRADGKAAKRRNTDPQIFCSQHAHNKPDSPKIFRIGGPEEMSLSTLEAGRERGPRRGLTWMDIMSKNKNKIVHCIHRYPAQPNISPI